MSYRGRFAPSPSGPLHLGSLVCALASYLDARQNNGAWLIRMEDIDPPREEKGAAQGILDTLQKHGLFSSEPVVFQSARAPMYDARLTSLISRNLSYRCSCSRKRLAQLNSTYDGHCLASPPSTNLPSATRLKLSAEGIPTDITFNDQIKGEQIENLKQSCGDFVIHRKDGLYAYQFAVVSDDIDQNITHIIRGDDLLDCTARQIFLTTVLGELAPNYAHIPVLLGSDGHKLSKQACAPAIENSQAQANLVKALKILKVSIPNHIEKKNITDILNFGCNHFNISHLKSS